MDKRALLLTRPYESGERFVARLAPDALKGVTLCFSPLLEIVPTGMTVDLAGHKGAIFTSTRGVSFGPEGAGRPAYCVGDQTRRAAIAAGWNVILMEQTADALVAAMGNGGVIGPLAHLAGVHRRGEVAERLRVHGISVDVAPLYDQVLQPLTVDAQEVLAGEVSVIVPLFSPRTAVQFVDQARQLRSVIFVAISAAVAIELAGQPVQNVHIAPEPTAIEMGRLVERLLRQRQLA